ncbi:kinesin-like protein Klp5 [Clydaea vesicula]|uniref:Kinesin-like protein n=1 Tax=Clydaea vesicula TaxID=447962 RepID=A0AAD5U309_9FUNG|nr:kinesin-like protein Klp5 [Clydaea vesicula]
MAQNESNFLVAIRVRPLLQSEMKAADASKSDFLFANNLEKKNEDSLVSIVDKNILVFDPFLKNEKKTKYSHGSRRNKEIRFGFDVVLPPESSQKLVFESTAKPLIDSILNAYNCTLFAYGATGCGKTHTISGTADDPGLIYLTMECLFDKIDKKNENNAYITEVSVSYLEVYNETIRDLLNPDSQPLELREEENKVTVVGLTEHIPSGREEIMKILLRGNENRTKAPTEANAVSSRSHAVLQIHVKQRERGVVNSKISFATLSIIDLAGSERASSTKNKGDRLLEGANINRLVLENIVFANFVVKISAIVMIAAISPATMHYEETYSTLKYANRAKNIKAAIHQNVIDVNLSIAEYPKVISELKERILTLEGALNTKTKLEEKDRLTSGLPQTDGVQTRSMLKTSSKHLENLIYISLEKCKKYFDKLRKLNMEFIALQLKIELNENRLRNLRNFLTSIPNIYFEGQSKETIHVIYDGLKKSTLATIDKLHQMNAALRFKENVTERSISKLKKKMEGRLQLVKNNSNLCADEGELHFNLFNLSYLKYENELINFILEKKINFVTEINVQMHSEFEKVLKILANAMKNFSENILNMKLATNTQPGSSDISNLELCFEEAIYTIETLLTEPTILNIEGNLANDVTEISYQPESAFDFDSCSEASTSFTEAASYELDNDTENFCFEDELNRNFGCDSNIINEVETQNCANTAIVGISNLNLDKTQTPTRNIQLSSKNTTPSTIKVNKAKNFNHAVVDDEDDLALTPKASKQDIKNFELKKNVTASTPTIKKSYSTSNLKLPTSFIPMLQKNSMNYLSTAVNGESSPSAKGGGSIKCSPARRKARNHLRNSLIPILRPNTVKNFRGIVNYEENLTIEKGRSNFKTPSILEDSEVCNLANNYVKRPGEDVLSKKNLGKKKELHLKKIDFSERIVTRSRSKKNLS